MTSCKLVFRKINLVPVHWMDWKKTKPEQGGPARKAQRTEKKIDVDRKKGRIGKGSPREQLIMLGVTLSL